MKDFSNICSSPSHTAHSPSGSQQCSSFPCCTAISSCFIFQIPDNEKQNLCKLQIQLLPQSLQPEPFGPSRICSGHEGLERIPKSPSNSQESV